MVCYSPMPQSEYTLKNVSENSKFVIGLGDRRVIKSEELWNYCVITSRFPYFWEEKLVKERDLPLYFPNLDGAKNDLQNKLGPYLVKDLMCEAPRVFFEAFNEYPISHLKMCKFFGSEEVFRSIVWSRIFTWRKAKGLPLTETQEAIIYMVKYSIKVSHWNKPSDWEKSRIPGGPSSIKSHFPNGIEDIYHTKIQGGAPGLNKRKK